MDPFLDVFPIENGYIPASYVIVHWRVAAFLLNKLATSEMEGDTGMFCWYLVKGLVLTPIKAGCK